MELLVSPLQKSDGAEPLPFALAQECDVEGGDAELFRQCHCARHEGLLVLLRARARLHQQSRSRHRRKGHRGLELRVVLATCTDVGLGPTVVEDVLPLAVALQIERHAGDDVARCSPADEMLRQPSRPAADGLGHFERVQKGVADERIEVLGIRVGARVPALGFDLGD